MSQKQACCSWLGRWCPAAGGCPSSERGWAPVHRPRLGSHWVTNGRGNRTGPTAWEGSHPGVPDCPREVSVASATVGDFYRRPGLRPEQAKRRRVFTGRPCTTPPPTESSVRNSHGDLGLHDTARLLACGVVPSYPAQTVFATTQGELATSWRASVDEQGASEADIGNVCMMAIWPTPGFERLFEITYRDLAAPVST